MVNLNISFDRSDHTYSPGDVINLDIRVEVSSNTKFRSIYVRLQGFAHVEWTESRQVQRNGENHTEYTTYESHESYFKNYQTLAGSQGGPDIQLAAGTHVYHASFALPQRLPQSHESRDGHIRYEAKVHVDVPWGFDEKQTVPFHLKPRFNLNEFPHLREPLRAESSKTFGCCWVSDPLRIYNVFPRSGFVPGERVQYSLELNNDSDVSVDSAYVKLTERIIYRVHSPSSDSREDRRTLWQHEFSSRDRQLVAAMQNKVFSTDLYFDPGWGLHCFDGCSIITVEYSIKSEARVSGCHTNLDNYSTIIMGTVPFSNVGSGPFITPLAPMLFPSAPIDNASAPPDEPISEQPLPSYNDTVSKPPPVDGLGWGTNIMDTPPPTFTEVELMNKKEKQQSCE